MTENVVDYTFVKSVTRRAQHHVVVARTHTICLILLVLHAFSQILLVLFTSAQQQSSSVSIKHSTTQFQQGRVFSYN